MHVEGSQRSRKWIDKEGREQKVTEVIVRFQGYILGLDHKTRDSDGEFSQHHPIKETERNTLKMLPVPFERT